MKGSKYQNVLLTIIAGCLIVITLCMVGVIRYSYKGEDVPIKISSVKGQNIPYRGYPVLPVEIR